MDSTRQAADHFGVQRCFELPAVTLAVVNIEDDLGTRVGWHYHENPHLTFILRGDVIEGTKKRVYHCSPGELLFHGAFEPHYNAKLAGSARCLHVDFHQDYLKTIGATKLDGIFSIRNPQVKVSCYKLFGEAVISDDLSGASMQSLSLEILGQLLFNDRTKQLGRPSWVSRLEEILRCDYAEKLSLEELSRQLAVHPVHLSRSFSRYFRCTLGEYVRNIRVKRSLELMSRKNLTLTEIATTCGFADQSHFTRSFKQIMGVSPSTYRRLLAG